MQPIQYAVWKEAAFIINKNSNIEWAVVWFIVLSTGQYGIEKEIIDFRAIDDYDTDICSTEFEI
mgnify:CR=1 FL=1